MRTELAVSKVEADFFGDFVKCIGLQSPDAINSSPEIVLLTCRKSDQIMNAYTMNLDDFFNSNWNAPRLTLKYSWCGPKTNIKVMKRHEQSGLLAALDESGTFSVYETGPNASLQLKTEVGVLVLAVLPSGYNVVEFSWVSCISRPILLISDANGVYLYNERLSVLEKLSNSLDIKNLIIVAGTTCQDFYIVGKNSENQFKTWAVRILEQNHIEQELLFETKLDVVSISTLFQPFSFDFGGTVQFKDYPSVFGIFDPVLKTISVYHFERLEKPTGKNEVGHSPFFVNTWSFTFSGLGFVHSLKPSSFGKLAIAHQIGNDHIVDVWDNEYTGLEINLEFQIKFKEPIIDMDWLTCYDGQHLLAIATKSSLSIYGKSNINPKDLWSKLAFHENFGAGLEIKALLWISQGYILLSTNEFCKLISPWILNGGTALLQLTNYSRRQSSCFFIRSIVNTFWPPIRS